MGIGPRGQSQATVQGWSIADPRCSYSLTKGILYFSGFGYYDLKLSHLEVVKWTTLFRCKTVSRILCHKASCRTSVLTVSFPQGSLQLAEGGEIMGMSVPFPTQELNDWPSFWRIVPAVLRLYQQIASEPTPSLCLAILRDSPNSLVL